MDSEARDILSGLHIYCFRLLVLTWKQWHKVHYALQSYSSMEDGVAYGENYFPLYEAYLPYKPTNF